ncbi:MAG: L,D-transpeptidase family protein [Betaproteobacteria bacterium]|nr:L,D-transpeptidase family protein [Betaproteobacteria bacterium]MDE1981422.1 L,D-transpeptidase family protein [Betaproteobacteria bacterium]MDE2131129.1 L,D-transpeptidase family protein [Betaproteobacteria bacterium]MDE2211749.1 L,D-transpeptidase family protein [Betaproteobacteria bacterium]
MTGKTFEYEVLPGDYLIRIAARFGESATLIARDNGIPRNRPIWPGQHLTLNNRHLVPRGLEEGLLINLPQRHLFFFREGRLVAAYPVGLGRPDWPTPAGAFRVTELRRHPAWHVPPSIQEEMRREGKAVRTLIPPGPDDPLGEYWIGISLDGVGIHGTIAPASVYHFQSHGCIRLHPADVEALYPQVVPGMPGRIIYEPVLLAGFPDGHIYLEVNPDVYHRRGDAWQTLTELAKAQGLADRIDWEVARAVAARKDGIAHPIQRGAANEP